jgi:hypothetical protein
MSNKHIKAKLVVVDATSGKYTWLLELKKEQCVIISLYEFETPDEAIRDGNDWIEYLGFGVPDEI